MDNHHVQIYPSHSSCGILELSQISSDPVKVAYALASYLYHPSRGSPAAFVLFSDTEDSNGVLLISFLHKTFPMGSHLWTRPVENPKTGNEIWTYVWIIPHEEFRAWYRDQRIERAKKV